MVWLFLRPKGHTPPSGLKFVLMAGSFPNECHCDLIQAPTNRKAVMYKVLREVLDDKITGTSTESSVARTAYNLFILPTQHKYPPIEFWLDIFFLGKLRHESVVVYEIQKPKNNWRKNSRGTSQNPIWWI